MNDSEIKKLLALASSARDNSYSPYSHFRVGAALMCRDGRIFTGCNIENASFGATVCAERTAIFKAVSEGERDFSALAIVGGREDETAPLCAPCGICRQVISEFCTPDFPIILGTPNEFRVFKLRELLPLAFTDKDL